MLDLQRHINCPIWGEELSNSSMIPWTGMKYACLKVLQAYCKVFDQQELYDLIVRKTCQSCKCPREAHAIYQEQVTSVRERLGFNAELHTSKIDPRQVGYSWVPPGILTSAKIQRYFDSLPEDKVPKIGSTGQRHRERQIAYQLPKQDLALTYCKHIETQNRSSYEDFVAARNEIALDIGYVKDAPNATKCVSCDERISQNELAVIAPKFRDQMLWHPKCFTCSACEELLVDLTYCVHEDKIYCERHYAEMLKPRCEACDEVDPITSNTSNTINTTDNNTNNSNDSGSGENVSKKDDALPINNTNASLNVTPALATPDNTDNTYNSSIQLSPQINTNEILFHIDTVIEGHEEMDREDDHSVDKHYNIIQSSTSDEKLNEIITSIKKLEKTSIDDDDNDMNRLQFKEYLDTPQRLRHPSYKEKNDDIEKEIDDILINIVADAVDEVEVDEEIESNKFINYEKNAEEQNRQIATTSNLNDADEEEVQRIERLRQQQAKIDRLNNSFNPFSRKFLSKSNRISPYKYSSENFVSHDDNSNQPEPTSTTATTSRKYESVAQKRGISLKLNINRMSESPIKNTSNIDSGSTPYDDFSSEINFNVKEDKYDRSMSSAHRQPSPSQSPSPIHEIKSNLLLSDDESLQSKYQKNWKSFKQLASPSPPPSRSASQTTFQTYNRTSQWLSNDSSAYSKIDYRRSQSSHSNFSSDWIDPMDSTPAATPSSLSPFAIQININDEIDSDNYHHLRRFSETAEQLEYIRGREDWFLNEYRRNRQPYFRRRSASVSSTGSAHVNEKMQISINDEIDSDEYHHERWMREALEYADHLDELKFLAHGSARNGRDRSPYKILNADIDKEEFLKRYYWKGDDDGDDRDDANVVTTDSNNNLSVISHSDISEEKMLRNEHIIWKYKKSNKSAVFNENINSTIIRENEDNLSNASDDEKRTVIDFIHDDVENENLIHTVDDAVNDDNQNHTDYDNHKNSDNVAANKSNAVIETVVIVDVPANVPIEEIQIKEDDIAQHNSGINDDDNKIIVTIEEIIDYPMATVAASVIPEEMDSLNDDVNKEIITLEQNQDQSLNKVKLKKSKTTRDLKRLSIDVSEDDTVNNLTINSNLAIGEEIPIQFISKDEQVQASTSSQNFIDNEIQNNNSNNNNKNNNNNREIEKSEENTINNTTNSNRRNKRRKSKQSLLMPQDNYDDLIREGSLDPWFHK